MTDVLPKKIANPKYLADRDARTVSFGAIVVRDRRCWHVDDEVTPLCRCIRDSFRLPNLLVTAAIADHVG